MFRGKTKAGYRFLLLILMVSGLLFLLYGRENLLASQEGCGDSMKFILKQSGAEETILPFFSEQDQLYYVFLPSCADLENVRVSFEGADKVIFEENETASPASADSGAGFELKKGMSLGSLQTDTEYSAVFLQGEDRKEEVGLKILRAENLPTLFIRTDSGSMDAVDEDKTVQEEGSYVLMDSDGTLLSADDLDHITGRGNSTWAYPKKSYSIKLESAANLLDMGKAQSWILLSNVEDTTYLRNKITYDMAIAAGMTGAPESRYVDLYINNEYNGMYLLCEKIEPGENRIPMADLDEENKRLNKNIELAEPVYTDLTKGVSLGAVPKDITGGYIVERDEHSKYVEEISGFQSALLGDLYVVKSPEYASQEEVSYISGLFAEMEKAVVAEDGINPDTGKDYLTYIDLQSFVQKYMIEEICKNNGGGATSSFFYKPQDSISTKIFGGPVWDYDKGYGAVETINNSRRDLCYLTLRDEGTLLFWYLNQHEEFWEEVKTCYKDVFSDYITSVIDEKIPAYIEQMYCSAQMDGIRWQEIYDTQESGSFEDDYEKRVSVVTDFLTERKAFLDEVWGQDAKICTVHFSAPELYIDNYMSVIEGECLTAMPLQETGLTVRGVIFDGWYTEDGEAFDMSQPVCEDVTVYARAKQVQE